MQNALVNLNGEILRPEEARVSVFDRGFIYGDSLYEVVRTYNGQVFGLKEHFDRLINSAKLSRMKLSQSIETYEKEIVHTIREFQAKEGDPTLEVYCRLIITRGTGAIGMGARFVESPTHFIIIVQALPKKTDPLKTLKLQVSSRIRNDRRALDPAMKSGNYMNNLLAFLEAEEQGFDDALLCNKEGHLTEGTTFNIFYVKRGIVATPPLDIGILPGITRSHLFDMMKKEGLPFREVYFSKERLYEADEVFISGTVKEVMAVSHVDRHKIKNGKPGPITRALIENFQNHVRGIS